MNIIEIKDLTIRYNNIVALEDVSLNIEEGSFQAIIGPNGSGKTTLLKAILGLVKPFKGSIMLFNKGIRDIGNKRSKIGYVSQYLDIDINFPVNALDIVLMGRYPEIGLFRQAGRKDKELAMKALSRVGADTLAKRRLRELSGGERQRVFLARALVNDPSILLLDEPTTGVDTTGSENFFLLLKDLHDKGITILLVSHDIGVIAGYSDRIICLNRKLIAHDKPDQVMEEGVLLNMYGKEAVFFHHHDTTPHIVVRKHEE